MRDFVIKLRTMGPPKESDILENNEVVGKLVGDRNTGFEATDLSTNNIGTGTTRIRAISNAFQTLEFGISDDTSS